MAATTDVDVGLVADIRFPGGTSTAILHEIRALRQAGASCALALVDAPMLARGRGPHPGLARTLDALGVPVLSPHEDCRCSLVLAHHPACWQRPPLRRLPLRAPRAALVAHHPAADRDGRQLYDYAVALANLGASLGVAPTVLPVGPLVRRSLEEVCPQLPLHGSDWPNLIELGPEPERPLRDGPLRIGRHSRPDPLKWPDPATARLVYPERPELRFLMLGVDDALRARFTPWPGNWQGLPFRPDGAGSFLDRLDVYAYYHDQRWIEAFGYNVLEALRAGLPTVLDPGLRPTFGDGPIYAAPEEAAAVYERLAANPGERTQAGRRARGVARRFGYETLPARLDALIGPARSRRVRPPAAERPDTLLVVTSNGIGAGHIMRQIAIARAAPPNLRTVFFTLSKSAGFARAAGFLTESRPHHRALGMEVEAWNGWIRDELLEAIKFYRADALIFDGNVPYGGLVEALDLLPGLRKIWMRRGMWRRPEETSEQRAAGFDAILEPGELAGSADPGFARAGGAPCTLLPPILPLPRGRGLLRLTARRLLGIPEEAFALLLALGAGQNRDIAPIRQRVYDAFPEALVVEPRNPLASANAALGPRHLHKPIFPLAQYLAAFDAAVTATGYNSFHEILAAGLPTLFVPNASSEMDLQEVRAEFAARAGWALSAGEQDPYGQTRALRELIRPDTRDALRAACAAIPGRFDGAEVAARHVTLTTRRIGSAA